MSRPKSPSIGPRGFTLIELLVVIVVLSLLVGLLVPAVMRAVGTARDAAVATEIQAMAQALADFKSRYNEFPPSRIVCSESGDYSTATIPPTNAAGLIVGRSVAALRRYWPRVQLNTGSTAGAAPGVSAAAGKYYDFNGNGQLDTNPYVLTGPECLVFFLGGIPQQTSPGQWSVTGFSKNPLNPFQTTTITTNREQPRFEFNNGRLVTNTLNNTLPSPGFPGYVDSLGAGSDAGVIPFYVYFSAYGGGGYDPGDCDMQEPDSVTGNPISGAFMTGNAPTCVKPVPSNTQICVSPAPNPYTSSCPFPTDSSGAPYTSLTPRPKPRAWINQNSFQIISPGRDRYYGCGGQWISQGESKLPFLDMSLGSSAGYTADSFQTKQGTDSLTQTPAPGMSREIRFREQDNVTNFAAGRLE